MHRSRLTAWVVTIATLQPLHVVAANQAPSQTVDRFRVSKSQLVDVDQETLQEINAESKRTTEVFPGTYTSPYGALVMKRLDDLLARVGDADRDTLVAKKVGAGFDRSITSWRAHPAGRTVAVAVHYHRARLAQLEKMELSDDYGRSEPLDPPDYEFFAVAVCSRSSVDAWTCQEEELAVAAKKHNVALPVHRAGWAAAAEKLLEVVLVNSHRDTETPRLQDPRRRAPPGAEQR